MPEITTVAISSALVGATWGLTYLVEKLFKPEIYFHTQASITSVMVPLVSKYRTPKTNVRIVGANGEYVNNKLFWPKTIESWLSDGNTISYLLINPSHKALTVFEKIRDKYPQAFILSTVKTDAVLKDERARELVRKYESFHFALFENPRQMWIEGCHQRKKNVAYDCEYVPPKDAVTDPRFDRFLSNFNQIQEASRAPILA